MNHHGDAYSKALLINALFIGAVQFIK